MISLILMIIDLILKIFTTHVHFFDTYYLEDLEASYICHLRKVMVYLIFSYGKKLPLKLVVFYDSF